MTAAVIVATAVRSGFIISYWKTRAHVSNCVHFCSSVYRCVVFPTLHILLRGLVTSAEAWNTRLWTVHCDPRKKWVNHFSSGYARHRKTRKHKILTGTHVPPTGTSAGKVHVYLKINGKIQQRQQQRQQQTRVQKKSKKYHTTQHSTLNMTKLRVE